MTRLLREVLDGFASVLFPAACRVCEAPLVNASRIPICQGCLESLQPLSGPACHRCGRPFVTGIYLSETKPLCHACRRETYAFDLARSYAAYDTRMVRAVTLLKYEAITSLGSWFAARLAELVAREELIGPIDLVVPVPLHRLRLRERGYNQAELIAAPLAKRLDRPLYPRLLVRTKPRPDRLKLSRRERWQTVRGAYAAADGERVDKLRILLVDDVFTTGATLDACARGLRSAGASRVVALTVARVRPEWAPPTGEGSF